MLQLVQAERLDSCLDPRYTDVHYMCRLYYRWCRLDTDVHYLCRLCYSWCRLDTDRALPVPSTLKLVPARLNGSTPFSARVRMTDMYYLHRLCCSWCRLKYLRRHNVRSYWAVVLCRNTYNFWAVVSYINLGKCHSVLINLVQIREL